MGSADIILDLVSTGVTLRENNLKQLEGAVIMQSQGALVANRRALLERPVSGLPLPRCVLYHAVYRCHAACCTTCVLLPRCVLCHVVCCATLCRGGVQWRRAGVCAPTT